MAKFVFSMFALAFIAVVSAQGGVKDWAGNYYDYSTGQYSSSLTGKVYNTAPVVAPAVVAASYAAPYGAPYAAPYAAHYSAPIVASAYASPYAASYAAPYPLAYGLWK